MVLIRLNLTDDEAAILNKEGHQWMTDKLKETGKPHFISDYIVHLLKISALTNVNYK